MGTNFNYDDTSHQVIYDQINGGSGSEPLQQRSQEWTKLGNEIGETGKSYVQKVLGTILATRQGAAADAAATAVSAMVPWMDSVTQMAHAAGAGAGRFLGDGEEQRAPGATGAEVGGFFQ